MPPSRAHLYAADELTIVVSDGQSHHLLRPKVELGIPARVVPLVGVGVLDVEPRTAGLHVQRVAGEEDGERRDARREEDRRLEQRELADARSKRCQSREQRQSAGL